MFGVDSYTSLKGNKSLNQAGADTREDLSGTCSYWTCAGIVSSYPKVLLSHVTPTLRLPGQDITILFFLLSRANMSRYSVVLNSGNSICGDVLTEMHVSWKSK